MHIQELVDEDVTVMALDGRLALGEATIYLHDRMQALLGDGRRRIVVDLGKVDAIDSAGLGQLISAFISAKNRGGAVKLANLSDRASDLLVTTKLDLIFERFPTTKEAVRSFRGSLLNEC